MSKYQENQNIVLGFIIGAAAGLAAGILLAPDAGEVTRQSIAKKATDLKDKANNLKGQVGSQINSTISKISDKTKAVTGQVTGQNGKKTSPKKPAGQSSPTNPSPNTDIVS